MNIYKIKYSRESYGDDNTIYLFVDTMQAAVIRATEILRVKGPDIFITSIVRVVAGVLS